MSSKQTKPTTETPGPTGLGVDAAKPSGSPEAPPDKKPASELNPAEQMAQFEEELKESDWGHQPC